ncbi:MAG: heavy metal translocating P-type ATPase, partial [Pseudomonadota bacterium]
MTQTHIFAVENLNCAACVRRLEAAVRAQDTVHDAEVNLATSQITLQVQGALSPVLAGMASAGYPARTQSVSVRITGASCGSCVARVEGYAADVPGVVSATFSLATETLQLEVIDTFEAQALRDAFGKTSYQIEGDLDGQEAADDPLDGLRRRAVLAAALTVPVVVLEMGGHLVPAFRALLVTTFGQTPLWLVQALLTSLVLAGPGRGLFVSGLRGLWHRAPDMNALVALGAGAAYLYSLTALLAPALLPAGAVHVYFEAAAVITTLILVGRWLEGRARAQARDAIGALLALQPPQAEVIQGDSTEMRPVAHLTLGTHVRLRPGMAVPVDGEVVAGCSDVDEALLTGEPAPVPKAPGDKVVGGSVNGTGTLDVRVTAVGRDTVLARIAAQVEAAQSG